MKFVKQFLIIIAVSFAGEITSYLLPFPVAGSVYGIVIMFLCLLTGLIKVDDVRETSVLLIDIMPIMFVPPAIELLDTWGLIKSTWYIYFIIAIVSTIFVMGVTGTVTQFIIKRQGNDFNDDDPKFTNIEDEFVGMSKKGGEANA